MKPFSYISSLPRDINEDLVQEAWCKALSRTEYKPNATTIEELVERYQHIAGLVTHIYRHEEIKSYKKRPEIPLQDTVGVWYNNKDEFENCTPQQIEAIQYYLVITNQGYPLTAAQRSTLSRLRKKTGLALYVEKGR